MAHPARNAAPANILSPSRIFFATTKASMGRRLLQSERNAGLLIDVLRSLVAEHRFKLHDLSSCRTMFIFSSRLWAT
jgi:putative transposase